MVAAIRPRLIAGEHLRRRSPAGILLVIDGASFWRCFFHDEGASVLDRPGQWGMAMGGIELDQCSARWALQLSLSPKKDARDDYIDNSIADTWRQRDNRDNGSRPELVGWL
jgi:hypothetical protein